MSDVRFCEAGHPAIAFTVSRCPICHIDPVFGHYHLQETTTVADLQVALFQHDREQWAADTRWETVLQQARRVSDRYSLTEDQQRHLFEVGYLHLPVGGTIVELGVCHGKTAIVLACLALLKHGTYTGIDTWGLEGSMEAVAAALPTAHTVRLLQGHTHTVGTVPLQVDLLLIDAGHDEVNVKGDCARWIPAVPLGGIVAFHDYDDPPNPESAHWAVRHYADLHTGTWQTLGLWGGLLIRRRV